MINSDERSSFSWLHRDGDLATCDSFNIQLKCTMNVKWLGFDQSAEYMAVGRTKKIECLATKHFL